MDITISVCGRFHAFYLAQQLLKRGYLKGLITSYPKFEVAKYGLPKDIVNSVVIKELMERGWEKFPSFLKKYYNPHYIISEIFDKWASSLYNKSDICVTFAGYGLQTIRKAKRLGSITVLERGSSHMLYQANILEEEYEKLGLKTQITHSSIIEKGLQEYEEADYISIPSFFVKRSFLKKGVPENKLIHVPYGVDVDDFKQILKEDNIFRVVYVGGLTVRKGIHYLLQAFSELNLPNSELLLIGGLNDEIRPFLNKYEGKYKYIGHVPQKELYRYYSQGSIFVMMSIEEGLAMVQPQAMACGLPVICTTNTGGEDIIRNGVDGFIIPIRNLEVLKEKVLFLYENPDICNAMGQSAKKRVTDDFTWDIYGDRMIKQYENIIEQKM